MGDHVWVVGFVRCGPKVPQVWRDVFKQCGVVIRDATKYPMRQHDIADRRPVDMWVLDVETLNLNAVGQWRSSVPNGMPIRDVAIHPWMRPLLGIEQLALATSPMARVVRFDPQDDCGRHLPSEPQGVVQTLRDALAKTPFVFAEPYLIEPAAAGSTPYTQ